MLAESCPGEKNRGGQGQGAYKVCLSSLVELLLGTISRRAICVELVICTYCGTSGAADEGELTGGEGV